MTELPAADTEPVLLGRPPQGDGSCRSGYGPPVLRRCGNACAYCGLDFSASYESWLHMSVDHVVPRQSINLGYETEWVEDLQNHVPCCRTCNEFLNGYKVTVPQPPASLAEFLHLRDQVQAEKQALAVARHVLERQKFQTWRATIS